MFFNVTWSQKPPKDYLQEYTEFNESFTIKSLKFSKVTSLFVNYFCLTKVSGNLYFYFFAKTDNSKMYGLLYVYQYFFKTKLS